jgi:hypothetical protein
LDTVGDHRSSLRERAALAARNAQTCSQMALPDSGWRYGARRKTISGL